MAQGMGGEAARSAAHLQRERDRRQRHERDAGAGFAPLVRRRCCRKTGRFPAKAHAVSARGAMLFIQSARTHEPEGPVHG